jgi:hypothetical protein
MCFSGNKIRSLNEIQDGGTYQIADHHRNYLITVLKHTKDSFIGQTIKSKNNLVFNWNEDFVLGKQEIYTITE